LTKRIGLIQCPRSYWFINFFHIGLSFKGGRRKRGNKYRQEAPKKLHRTNQEIRAKEVRLLDSEGEMIGIMSVPDALKKAQEAGVDLVEVSPKAVPPVCRIIDYGKMLYALKKKAKQQAAATKKPEQKGIRLTFRMDVGDMERQKKHAIAFLEDGHSVRVQLMMRGREKAHKDIAYEKIKSFVASLVEYGKPDQPPKGAGHQIIMVVKPTKSSK